MSISPPPVDQSTPSYAVESISGKGLGVRAIRPILSGELILSESPLFIQPVTRNLETVCEALSILTIDQQRDYFHLTNCHSKEQFNPILGTFETNCLPIGSGTEGREATQTGLFLTASRFNSSCAPNVNNVWDEPSNQERLYAVRDIAAGEELCIDYSSDPFSPRTVRQAYLERVFGFLCQCSVCALPEEAGETSDRNRVEIGAIYSKLVGMGGTPEKVMQSALRALELLEQEGIYQYRDSFAYEAFHICVAASDFLHAKQWAQYAYNAAVVVTGEDGGKAGKYKGLVKNVLVHHAAGTGKRKTFMGPPS